MGKIGVFSDTHDQWEKIQKAIEVFIAEGVQKIVHCGDIISPFMANYMTQIKDNNIEAVAVYGNNDGERAGLIKFMKNIMDIKGDFHEMEWESRKIALYHGTDQRILKNIIHSTEYDLVLCGHTHQIKIDMQGNTLIVNPGTASGYLTDKATVAIIDLAKAPFDISAVEIIEL